MSFKFSIGEPFPRLSSPPIVEAVIHWRASAQSTLEPEALRKSLLERLPEFKTCEPFQHFAFEAELIDEQGKANFKQSKKTEWHGFRLTTEDGRHIAQFNRDGVIFSCVRQYEHWESFIAAAKRVWAVFIELARPNATERLGVRFINQFKAAIPETLDGFLVEPPTRPLNLPLKEFVYQSTISVPDHPYEARIIKIMQPRMPDLQQGTGLFVDLDVYMTTPLENDAVSLDRVLTEIRYLKNKVFFTLITPNALKEYMESAS